MVIAFADLHAAADVLQVTVLFNQMWYVVEAHGEHPQVGTDGVDMSRTAIAFQCHQYEGEAEEQAHCHADAEIAHRFAVGDEYAQAGDETVVLPQLAVAAVLNVVVVLFEAVV